MRAPTITFPALLQDFFLRRLIEQRGVSARTVESYRDAFELLLGFAEQRTGKRASCAVARGPGRPARARLPRAPRTRAGKQRPHPQRSPGGDPLVHVLRLGPRPHLRCRSPDASSRSPRSALTNPSSATSRARRSTLCSPPPTAAPGADDATRSCSPRCTTPARASRRSPRCASATSSWTANSPFTCTAKDAGSA